MSIEYENVFNTINANVDQMCVCSKEKTYLLSQKVYRTCKTNTSRKEF